MNDFSTKIGKIIIPLPRVQAHLMYAMRLLLLLFGCVLGGSQYLFNCYSIIYLLCCWAGVLLGRVGVGGGDGAANATVVITQSYEVFGVVRCCACNGTVRMISQCARSAVCTSLLARNFSGRSTFTSGATVKKVSLSANFCTTTLYNRILILLYNEIKL